MDEPEPSVAPPRSSLLRSRLGLRGAFVLALGAVLAFVPRRGDGAGSPDRAAVEALRCEAAYAFRAHHGVAPDLSLLEVQVVFRAAPVGSFVAGEGFVTIRVGVSLPGAQEVLEVRGDPEPAQKLDVDGTIDAAAAKLSVDAESLRARCRRAVRRDGDTIVAPFGGGIIAIRFGRSWRARVPGVRGCRLRAESARRAARAGTAPRGPDPTVRARDDDLARDGRG